MQELPIRFKIGSRWYSVQQHHRKHTSCHGRLKPTLRNIEVFSGPKRNPRTPTAVRQTFWHEVTHAILYDMQHDLWDNEYFVEEFSKRLSQAIDTSEFKDEPAPGFGAAPIKEEGKRVFYDERDARWRK